MPSSRRLKATGLIAILVILIIFYVTNGARSTHNSPFYTRTVAAIKARQEAQARGDIAAEEHQRRVEKVEREHKVAVAASAAHGGDAAHTTKKADPYDRQEPIVGRIQSTGLPKPVAGRKMMGDGKVVQGKGGDDDGVAKVGNVAPKSSHAVVGGSKEMTEEDKVEAAFDEILKKGPIIIFSKSYCPFSKKAKHILLDLYSITPPPYVVELDQHDLGSGLQDALLKMTGRRTVPNVLINGLSIGGGNDVEEMHINDKLISTIKSKGGKRIMSVEKVDEESEHNQKAGLRFRA